MGSQIFDSNELSVSAVKGVNTGTPAGAPPECVGVEGQSDLGVAIAGHSVSGFGVHGFSENNFGVRAVSNSGVGLRATSEADRPAIEAQAKQNGIGVDARSNGGAGVLGTSDTNDGVVGKSNSAFGVLAQSNSGVGLRATSEADRPAIEAQAKQNGIAVVAQSNGADAVLGISATGIGVHGKGGHLAGFFEGDVEVTGDIRLTNADFAEDFDIADCVEPGTVMVLNQEGALRESHQAYDKHVAGVVSGAGRFKPGIVLDRHESQSKRLPIALLGKVYCKVEAQSAPIEVGDLLTTSGTLGHAMKACDPGKAFGAVIGKALKPWPSGQGFIPILIALQ
jgi:hypothetical protein